MLTSVLGVYRNGHIELEEPVEAPDDAKVIVTFISPLESTDDYHEAEILSRSPTFLRLVEHTLGDVEVRTMSFDAMLDELPD